MGWPSMGQTVRVARPLTETRGGGEALAFRALCLAPDDAEKLLNAAIDSARIVIGLRAHDVGAIGICCLSILTCHCSDMRA